MIYNPAVSFDLRYQSGICNSCSMGMNDLPNGPSASAYITGKSRVLMLQLVYSTWVMHLKLLESAGSLRDIIIYIGLCLLQTW